MGNTHSLTPKEGNESFVLTRSLLEEFQSCMTLVDNTVIGVAKAIDTLSLLFQRLGNDGDDKCSKGPNQPEDMEKMLFRTMTECLAQQKNIMIESVENLLTVIVESFKDNVESWDGGLTSFRVAKYKNKAVDSKSSADFMAEFLERSLASMKKEVAYLNDKINIQSDEIRTLVCKNTVEKNLEHYEKEKSQSTSCTNADNNFDDYVFVNLDSENVETKKQVTSEIQKLTDTKGIFGTEKEGRICKSMTEEQQQQQRQLQQAQIESSALKVQMKNLADDNTKYRNDWDEIQRTLEKSKKTVALRTTEKKMIHKETQTSELIVQVCHKSSSSVLHADEQLHALLKKELLNRGYQLETIPATPEHFDEKIPFLASWECKAKSKWFRKNTLSNALEEFKSGPTANVALLIFYETNESVLQKAEETVQDSKKCVTDIYHVKYSFEHKIFDSEENQKAIKGIADFIECCKVMESSV